MGVRELHTQRLLDFRVSAFVRSYVCLPKSPRVTAAVVSVGLKSIVVVSWGTQ